MARHLNTTKRTPLARKFAIATAAAKKAGFSSFKEGSPGFLKRRQIAEGIAERGLPALKRRRKRPSML